MIFVLSGGVQELLDAAPPGVGWRRIKLRRFGSLDGNRLGPEGDIRSTT
jgi:hypothetical protein